jgi:hypothetical protein
MSTAPLPAVLTGEQLEHVAIVAKRRTGKRPSPATVWRWCRKGVRGGIRLHAVYAGYWATTTEAFDLFLKQQTDATLGQGQQVVADIDADLQAAGLL